MQFKFHLVTNHIQGSLGIAPL